MIKPLPIITTHWPISQTYKFKFGATRIRKSDTAISSKVGIPTLRLITIVMFTCLAFTSCKKIECKPEPKRPKLSYPVDRNPQIPNIPAPKGGYNGN